MHLVLAFPRPASPQRRAGVSSRSTSPAAERLEQRGPGARIPEAAKSVIETAEGIRGDLPEDHPFAGLVVLVGTVLFGIATIQEGGVSLL